MSGRAPGKRISVKRRWSGVIKSTHKKDPPVERKEMRGPLDNSETLPRLLPL